MHVTYGKCLSQVPRHVTARYEQHQLVTLASKNRQLSFQKYILISLCLQPTSPVGMLFSVKLQSASKGILQKLLEAYTVLTESNTKRLAKQDEIEDSNSKVWPCTHTVKRIDYDYHYKDFLSHGWFLC